MGGSYKHQLTEAEMPEHHHDVAGLYGGLGDGGALQRGWQEGTVARAIATSNVGDNAEHNNMPPYIVVNIWKRTE